jgi:hypothetical protein
MIERINEEEPNWAVMAGQVNEETIVKAEARLGVRFPEQYREFIRLGIPHSTVDAIGSIPSLPAQALYRDRPTSSP